MKILINGHENSKYPAQYVEGLIGFTKSSEDQHIYGALYCNEYIDVIESIQTDRFLITNVDVVEEKSGTNNFIIQYQFEAEDSDIKYLGDPLSAQQRIDVEKNIFGQDRIDEHYYDVLENDSNKQSRFSIYNHDDVFDGDYEHNYEYI